MEISNVSHIFVNHQIKNIPNNMTGKLSFANILNSMKGISLTANDTSELRLFAKSPNSEENVDQISELEDKYCSLCGSMIEEDGSCPLCGVPVFISGNGQSRNQNTSQVDQAHSMFKYKSITFSKGNKVGRKG